MGRAVRAQPHSHGSGRGQHGNPEDLDGYIAKMESPDRDEWQKPAEVLRAIGVRAGEVIGDIGAGPGYFSLRVGRAVGEEGTVFASEVAPRILSVLRNRVAESGLRNVLPVLALSDDPLLPRGTCDRALIVNTFHHFPDPVQYLRTVSRSLKKGGQLINIDFHKRELHIGPPVEHKIAREDFLKLAAEAGFTLKAEHTFLPYQYFLVLEPPSR